jgi:hypothetical protein
LFYVAAAVDDVHDDVADRPVGVVDGNPCPPVVRIAGKDLDRSRLVVRNMIQPVVSVPLARGPLDVAQEGQVLAKSRTDPRRAHTHRFLSLEGRAALFKGPPSGA